MAPTLGWSRPLVAAALLLLLVCAWAAAQSVPAPVVHYPMSEGTGGTTADIAGKTTARLNGALWVKSDSGVALDLDGMGNSVECGDPPAAHLAEGSLSFAVTFRTNEKRQQYVLTHYGWSLYLDAEAIPNFETRSADNSKWENLAGTKPVPIDEWVQVVCVYDEAQRQTRLYVNGVLDAKGEKQPGFGGIGRSKLALGAWPGAHFLSGLIGDTRIWNVALTDAQVQALYQGTAAQRDGALVSPPRRLSVKLHPFPASGALALDVSLRSLGEALPEPGGTVELVREGKVEATKSGSLSTDGRAQVAFETAKLPPGRYEVRATATSAGQLVAGSTCTTEWVKPETMPWWFDSEEGMGGRLMAPWTPVQAKTSGSVTSLSCWGRRYDFADTPLPQAINSAGGSLLAAPMQLVVRTSDGEVKWRRSTVTVRKRTAETALLEVRCSSPTLALWGLVGMGYDGMVRLDLAVLPREAVQIRSLTLVIPLATEHARYLYTYPDRSKSWKDHRPGAVPAKGVSMPFNPTIWLGDEKRGLQWFAESDQDWLPADPRQAVRIKPQGKTTWLELELIGQRVSLDPSADNLVVGSDEPVKELSYTCGLMATPVRPVDRDAWDLRSTTLYANVYEAVEPGPDGKSQLDVMAENGVKTVSLMDWTDILCYNQPTEPEQLKRFVAACHQRDMQVLVYFGFQMSDATPEFAQYLEEAANWSEPREYSYEYGLDNYPPKPVQTVYRVCYRSLWEDFVVAGAAKLVDEFGIDGVYLDGTTVPLPCYNGHHGCGYRNAQDQWRPTLPIFECRRFAQRLYTALRSRNPRAQVNLHNSAFMVAPSIAYATSLWDGEQLSDAPGTFMLDRLPPDMFRTEFMGHNWGVPQEFLDYVLPGDYPAKWGLTLLHDVPTRPYGAKEQLPYAAALWRLMDQFGRKEATWYPYWSKAGAKLVTVTPAGVYASLYQNPKTGVLLVVDNLGREEAEATVKLNLTALKLPKTATAKDGLTDQALELKTGALTLRLPALGWRVVWVR